MDVREIAEHFAALCASGKSAEAAMAYWADDIATYEAAPGDFAETHGRAEAVAKAEWWFDNHEVHGMEIGGPHVHGDQFILSWKIEVTPKGGARQEMLESILYTVREGRIIEERYFY